MWPLLVCTLAVNCTGIPSLEQLLVYGLWIGALFVFALRTLAGQQTYCTNDVGAWFVLVVIAMWFYGFSRGLLVGNNPPYVFANFAGMLIFSVYWLLPAFFRKIKVESSELLFILLTVNLASMYVYAMLYLSGMCDALEWLCTIVGGKHSAVVEYGEGLIPRLITGSNYLVAPLYVITLVKLMSGIVDRGITAHRKVGTLGLVAILILSFVAGALLTQSKASLTAMIIATTFVWIKMLPRYPATALLMFLSAFGVSVLAYIADLGNIQSQTIPHLISELTGNVEFGTERAARWEQAYYLAEEFTPLGNGLGATHRSLERSELAPYGFELSFFNLVHKLGLFAIPVIVVYGTTVWFSVVFFFRNPLSVRAATPLAAQSYLIYAFTNPILFGAPPVILQCIALYSLFYNKKVQ
jgi:hypothetical protein